MTDFSIGVVNAPAIAAVLRDLHFTVVTDEGFRASATAVSTALKADKFPVIVADSHDQVLAQWAANCARRSDGMLALGTDGLGLFADQPEFRADAAQTLTLIDEPMLRLPLPATVNDLLAALGFAGTDAEIGSRVIERSGDVVPAGAGAPAPLPADIEDDFVFPDEETSPAAPSPDEASDDVDDEEAAPASVEPSPVFAAEAPAAADIFAGRSPVAAAAATQPPVFVSETTASTPDAGTELDAPAPAFTPIGEPAPTFVAPAAPEPMAAPVFPAPAPIIAPAEPAPLFNAPPIAPLELPAAIAPTTHSPSPAPAPVVPAPVVDHVDVVAPLPVASVTTPDDYEDVAPIEPVARAARAERPRSVPPRGTKHGEVIFTGAGKGGVGKTTTALGIAATAAQAGLQAILIDANRGQADVRKYLRLGAGELRTIHDAYAYGDPVHAFLMPMDHTPARTASRLDPLDFGIVLGPPSELSDPRTITPKLYGDVIDYARSIADVVVVDTQIVEATSNRTDLWNKTVIPMLGGDAWLVAITDDSPGVENLHERLSELRRDGVQPARTMILASQYLDFGREEVDYFQREFGDLGEFIGNTGIDDHFAAQLNLGRIDTNSTAMRPALNSILLRATGRADLFDVQVERSARPAKAPAKFSLFGKKKRA